MSHFLSCDWGSSSFRLRLVEIESGAIKAEVNSGKGATVLAMGVPKAAGAQAREWAFADHLDDMLGELQSRAKTPLADLPVVISGMATSAHGWRELPYADVPFAVDGSDIAFAEERVPDTSGQERHIYFISGLRTERDVMRGEEMELVGLFGSPPFDGCAGDCLVVMPGTHAKHVRVRNGRVIDYRTHMTGELYNVLREHSVLRLTAETPGNPTEPRLLAAFRDGVRRVRAEGLSASLFLVRTNGLFDRYAKDANAAFLSGLLIGNEMAELAKVLDAPRVILCAAGAMRSLYAAAMRELGIEAEETPPERTAALSTMGHRAFIMARAET